MNFFNYLKIINNLINKIRFSLIKIIFYKIFNNAFSRYKNFNFELLSQKKFNLIFNNN